MNQEKVYRITINGESREITVRPGTDDNVYIVTLNGTEYTATYTPDESGTGEESMTINGLTQQMHIENVSDGRYDVLFDGLEYDVVSQLISSIPISE